MKKVKFRPEFKMTAEEIAAYEQLPDNLPDINLTKKQIEFVSGLYYKYIGKIIDRRDWSIDMYREEMKKKWPSGPRMREHQAKRIILNRLVELNKRGDLSLLEASREFHIALTCRPMYSKLLFHVYEVKY